jgi:hypothetical protein
MSEIQTFVQELIDLSKQETLDEIPYFLHKSSSPQALDDRPQLVDDIPWELLLSSYLELRSEFLQANELIESGLVVLQHYELLVASGIRSSLLPRVSGVTLATILHQLRQDVLTLTYRVQNNPLVRGMAIPTLLKIAEHVLSQSSSDTSLDPIVGANQAALLLCFGDTTFSVEEFVSTKVDILKHCAVPTPEDESIILDVMDEPVSLNATAWQDQEYTMQCCNSCWKALAESLNIFMLEQDLVSQLCRTLSFDRVTNAVRRQFFDRIEEPEKTKMPLVYPLPRSSTLKGEPAYERQESRIHALLHLIQHIPSITTSLMAHLLPMCYALVDSARPQLVAMGSATLIAVFNKSTNALVRDMEEPLLSVLDLAMRTASDARALGILGMATSKAFQVLPHRRKERRRFVFKLVDRIRVNQSRQSDDEGILRALLVGGLIPLLQQQADEPTAEAMEVGRLGLEALLPLLRWDWGLSGRKVQLAALVALVNLMSAAYPIMPNHGGAILCELLACWGHANRSLQEDNKLKQEERQLCLWTCKLSTHVAAVALAFCGDRGLQVLSRVKVEGDFEKDMVAHVMEVEKHHEQLVLQTKSL